MSQPTNPNQQLFVGPSGVPTNPLTVQSMYNPREQQYYAKLSSDFKTLEDKRGRKLESSPVTEFPVFKSEVFD